MVSGIGFGGRKSRPYRKHRPLPALIVITALGVGAMLVWVNVIVSNGDIDDAVRCEPAASPPPGVTYTQLDHDALDNDSPAPPDKVAVTVLNASDMRGQAQITTESIRNLGFSQIGAPTNDEAYQGRQANCRGQIRFGENGTSSARTVSFLNPCLQLIKDTREDASVDLMIGNGFGDVRPNRAALDVLRQLQTWSQEHPEAEGSEAATQSAPVIDKTLLASAHEGTC